MPVGSEGSEERRGQSLAPVGGTGILGTEQLEEIDEFLSGRIVTLDRDEEFGEPVLDLVRARESPAAAHIGSDPSRLCGLGDTTEELECLVAPVVASEEFGQIGDHLGVVGRQFERLAQTGLVTCQTKEFHLVGVPGRETYTMNTAPFDLPAVHIYKIWNGQIHEIEALGLTTGYMSKTGWE